ncbi:hypothetical protein CapIbe_014244 [Capra ibex]
MTPFPSAGLTPIKALSKYLPRLQVLQGQGSLPLPSDWAPHLRPSWSSRLQQADAGPPGKRRREAAPGLPVLRDTAPNWALLALLCC